MAPTPEPANDVPVDLSGWTRTTTIDEPRLSELVELYEELGHEVILRPVSREELGDDCLECYLLQPERFRTIYTRPARSEGE